MTAKKGAATKIIIIFAIIVVAGLAFYMGRQSSTAPVVENPPVADNTSEVEETSKPENLSTSTTVEQGDLEFHGYTQAERYAVYESEYNTINDIVKSFPDLYENPEARLQGELNGTAHQLYTKKGLATPEGHEREYLAWRDEFHPENAENENTPSADQVNSGDSIYNDLGIGNIELFDTKVETVYATATVNVRDTFSTDGNKVGQLQLGQKVTRVGTGKIGEDAEGWSKIVQSDGSIVYVSSKYLSTSKPSTSESNTGTPTIEVIPNSNSEEKPTSNSVVNKPESSGSDPNDGSTSSNSGNQDSTNIPENAPGTTQLTWTDQGGEMENMDGGNSDKPIDNSHLINHG